MKSEKTLLNANEDMQTGSVRLPHYHVHVRHKHRKPTSQMSHPDVIRATLKNGLLFCIAKERLGRMWRIFQAELLLLPKLNSQGWGPFIHGRIHQFTNNQQRRPQRGLYNRKRVLKQSQDWAGRVKKWDIIPQWGSACALLLDCIFNRLWLDNHFKLTKRS